MDSGPALPPFPALLAVTPTEGLLRLGALLAAITLVVWLLYGRRPVLPARQPMTFLEHLKEFGDRAVRIVLLLVLWTTVFLTLRFERFYAGPIPLATPVLDVFDNAAARLYVVMARDTVPEGVGLLVSRPTEAVMAQLQVGLLVGVILTLPAFFFEVWAFFSPGLRPNERRVLAASFPAAVLLFVAGAAFAYAYVVPLLLTTFYGFATPLGAVPYLSVGSLVGTVVTFLLLFGAAFQLPLAMVVLVRIRVTTPRSYLRYWRHATVVIFIVAAIVTDPTVVSQLIVATLLLALYWGGVLLSVLLRPRPRTEPAANLRDGSHVA